jgi:7,8-dihydropterin-6-yl-methyl-4-(beta-D-ribofuranosyl)aminobenzene 5'-phosphate synthase
MKLTVLVENTACGEALEGAHGLSLLIETGAHRILFDAGPAGELLLHNAAALGVDLGAVDVAVLSHGHYDHAGGLLAFFGVNDRAPLWLQRGALDGHYANEKSGFRYVGLDPQIRETFSGRLRIVDGNAEIDRNLTLFSDVRTADFLSKANQTLLEPDGDGYIPDRFLHEQNLLIRENGRLVLIAGCAHRGIVNILRRAAELAGRAPDAVYAGFHLTNPGLGVDELSDSVRAIGAELRRWPCRFYTGHCTGQGPYGILKELLGAQLAPLSVGAVFEA